MAESNNYDELEFTWKEWHEQAGRGVRENYAHFMELSNDAAKRNQFLDTGDMWRFDYEDDNLQQNMINLWDKVKPLYNELHTYVLHRLIELYGTDKISPDTTHIPAHLLGNMWGQSWVNLYERIKPFKSASDIDVTAAMQVS